MSRPVRSKSVGSLPGGPEQFLHGLSPRQLQHLKFSVPKGDDSNRTSRFLEGPRQVPVPKRFTFDALDDASRKECGRARSGTRSTTRSMRSMTPTLLFKEAEKAREVDWRFAVTISTVCLLNLVAACNTTALPPALPSIASSLHGSGLQALWLGTSFFLAAATFYPVFMIMADVLGRKAMLLVALTFLTIGSFVGAVAGKFGGLIFARTSQGIGCGGLYALTNILLMDMIAAEDRTRWSRVVSATWALGIITGPVIGGTLADQGQWRWIFWLTLPFCGFAFMVFSIIAQLKAPESCDVAKLSQVDWLGYALFIASLVSVLLALTWGGVIHPWSNFRSTLPFEVGLAGFLGCLVWSYFSTKPSLVRISVLLDASSLATNIGGLVLGMVSSAALYFLPIYLEVAKRSTPFRSGLGLLPFTCVISITVLVTILLVSGTARYRPAIWVGWFIVTLGVALFTLFNRTTGTLMVSGLAVLLGVGVGILYPTLEAASKEVAKPENLPHITTAYAFFQLLGQMLGVAVAGTIFQNGLRIQLEKQPLLKDAAVEYTRDAIALVQTIRTMPNVGGSISDDIEKAFATALRPIWITMAILAGAAFITSMLIRAPEIKQEVAQEPHGLGLELGVVDAGVDGK